MTNLYLETEQKMIEDNTLGIGEWDQVKPSPIFYPKSKGTHPAYQEATRECSLINNKPLPPRIKCTKQQNDTVMYSIREFVGDNIHIEANMPMYFEIEEK